MSENIYHRRRRMYTDPVDIAGNKMAPARRVDLGAVGDFKELPARVRLEMAKSTGWPRPGTGNTGSCRWCARTLSAGWSSGTRASCAPTTVGASRKGRVSV